LARFTPHGAGGLLITIHGTLLITMTGDGLIITEEDGLTMEEMYTTIMITTDIITEKEAIITRQFQVEDPVATLLMFHEQETL
jgi:hypothetical protein